MMAMKRLNLELMRMTCDLLTSQQWLPRQGSSETGCGQNEGERASAAALDDDHRDNDDHGKHGDNDDKSWTMTLAIYDDDDNCSDD